jgi:hypothetical protein
MKNVKFVLVIIVIFSLACRKEDELIKTTNNQSEEQEEDQEQDIVNFEDWSDSLSFDQVMLMYDSAKSFMSDIRVLSESRPFIYKDSIISQGVFDTTADYHRTTSEGMTTVWYYDSLIFQNTWNAVYMDNYNWITTLRYGEVYNTKILRITNESHLPPNDNHPNGYYSRENELFMEIGVNFEEIALEYYTINEIKALDNREVIIYHAINFVRNTPRKQYLVLFDIATQENKIFQSLY